MAHITFALVSEDDFRVLYDWLQNPIVKKRYHDGQDGYEAFVTDMKEMLQETSQFAYCILIDGTKIGYIQCYNAREADFGAWGHIVPKGTWGLDMYIGEDDYRGKGYSSSIIQTFIDEIIIGKHHAHTIMIDPAYDNDIAIKAYEKVGFVKEKEVYYEGEKEILMYYRKVEKGQ